MRSEAVQKNTKQVILKNALSCFSKNGFDGTSMREIASHSKVAKPAVYYYFNNKEGLFEELVDDSFDVLYNITRRAVENKKTTKSKILALFSTFENMAENYKETASFLFLVVLAPKSTSFSKKINRHLDKHQKIIKNIFAKGVLSGEIKKEQEIIWEILISSLGKFYIMHLLSGRDYKRHVQKTLQFLLSQIDRSYDKKN